MVLESPHTIKPQSPRSLLASAWEAEVMMEWKAGVLRFGGPGSRRALLKALAENRSSLSQLLRPGVGESVQLGEHRFPYRRWSGEQLGPRLAFDTETTVETDRSIVPQLVLASASDGRQHFLIHPDDIRAFVVAHSHCHFAAHNCGFDFWVVLHHLRGDVAAQELWWHVVDEDRLHDTMILDGLLRLAQSDAYPRPRDLGTLSSAYADLTIDKADPCRMRYGSILGRPWEEVERCFFDYAVSDAIVTFRVWEELTRRVSQCLDAYSVPRDAIDRWGPLTEAIQVKGAIALAAIERTGLDIDASLLQQLRAGLEQQRAELVERLDAAAPQLLTRDSAGRMKLTKHGSPRKSLPALAAALRDVAVEAEVEPPATASGRITTASDYWRQHDRFPFVADWLQLEELTKLLSFFAGLDRPRIHPRYTTMVRTGRTSCSGPNVQQLPRSGRVREAIVAPEGRSFFAIDYSFIELRTLAAVCEERYGWSQLATTIREGVDPHCFVAAMFEGVELEEFLTWKKTQPDRFASLRQRAKALNFGIPGGLGAKTLTAYAKATYGVNLSLDEAERFRSKLITEVFPELGRYLREDTHSIAARQLQCETEDLRRQFPAPSHLGCVRRILRGETVSSKGEPYKADHIEAAWQSLERLCNNPELTPLIADRDTSDKAGLARKLFGVPVMTLTGRIRGRVSFTAARNTPFQGLAADGAKLAMFDLIRQGYTIHAFIHDEFLLSLQDDADWIEEPKRINSIICEAMQRVCGTIPIEAEGARMKRWYKGAKPVYGEQGELLIWEPSETR